MPAQYTRGPWAIHPNKPNIVYSKSTGKIVAKVAASAVDMKLIAAAPGLLDALVNLLSELDGEPMTAAVSELIDEALDQITVATGIVIERAPKPSPYETTETTGITVEGYPFNITCTYKADSPDGSYPIFMVGHYGGPGGGGFFTIEKGDAGLYYRKDAGTTPAAEGASNPDTLIPEVITQSPDWA